MKHSVAKGTHLAGNRIRGDCEIMKYGSSHQKWLYYNSPSFIKNAVASLYGWIQKRQRCGEHFERYMESLSESQWFPSSKLEELQLQKTKAFLLHAGRHSKYYRELFRTCDFKPEDMQSLSDLRALPILDKTTTRNRVSDIICDDLRRFNARSSHTSGTTGHGLRLMESSECFQREFAFRVQGYSWGGIRLGSKWAFCAGHPVAHHDQRTPPFWVHDHANNWLLLSSYHLTESNLPHYIAKLQKFQPELLGGYPSSIYLLALANQHQGSKVRPCAIHTSSETLFGHQRKVIEASFRCKVFTYYGNAERSAFIAECEKGVYHFRPEHSYVEFLDRDDKPVEKGSEGRMICTAFGNYAMPLIRYDIGDVAVVSKSDTCACGRSGPLIDRIVGRTDDYIVTPDGRFVGRLGHLFTNATNVRMAQIVQDNVEQITIRIVRDLGYDKEDEQTILSEAHERLGRRIDINFDYVADIPRTKNGKFRFIVSNVTTKKLFSKPVASETK